MDEKVMASDHPQPFEQDMLIILFLLWHVDDVHCPLSGLVTVDLVFQHPKINLLSQHVNNQCEIPLFIPLHQFLV